MQFLLVDQTGKRTGMKSGQQLAQAILAGDLQIVAGKTKPLVERTMETIFKDLNLQVQSVSQKDRHVG